MGPMNHHTDGSKVTYEWCNHCDYKNEFPADFKIHKCKCCGKELLPCAMCYVDETECHECNKNMFELGEDC